MIIDGDVDILPAWAVLLCIPAVAGHPVSGSREATQLLDVQVKHVTGRRMFVAIVRARWIKDSEPVETCVLKQASHGASPDTQLLGDLAVGLSLPATRQNLPDTLLRGGMRTAPGPR